MVQFHTALICDDLADTRLLHHWHRPVIYLESTLSHQGGEGNGGIADLVDLRLSWIRHGHFTFRCILEQGEVLDIDGSG